MRQRGSPRSRLEGHPVGGAGQKSARGGRGPPAHLQLPGVLIPEARGNGEVPKQPVREGGAVQVVQSLPHARLPAGRSPEPRVVGAPVGVGRPARACGAWFASPRPHTKRSRTEARSRSSGGTCHGTTSHCRGSRGRSPQPSWHARVRAGRHAPKHVLVLSRVQLCAGRASRRRSRGRGRRVSTRPCQPHQRELL